MGFPADSSQALSPGIYPINQPSVCVEHAEVLLLVIIRTVFAHFDRRTVIRETWGARKNYHGSHTHVLFFFDMSDNKHIQESIQRESVMCKDIVQFSAMDEREHTNLTLKASLAAQWAGEFCPRAKFVLVADDNIIVDIFKILPFLRDQQSESGKLQSNSIALCHFRTSANEMLLAKHEKLSEDRNFCSNEAFVASLPVLEQLYLTIKLKGMDLKRENLWLSDIARAAGIKFTNTSQHFAGARKKPSVLKTFMAMDYVKSSVMIGVVSEVFQGKEATIMRHIWRVIQEHHSKLQISNVYHAQFPAAQKGHDLGGVKFMAIVLMCIDFTVVAVIFALIFCRKKRKKWW